MSRITWPAAGRNRDVILQELRPHAPESGLLVEVGSGTGQHTAHFAQAMPGLTFQPTDWEDARFASIAAWSADLPNVRAPQVLDASSEEWPVEAADALYCANVVHISPVEVLHGLLRGAGRILPAGGLLALYGPYLIDGKPTTESNAAFDRSLQDRDPRWGLRDLGEVTRLAAAQGLSREDVVAMPANNFFVVFRRDA